MLIPYLAVVTWDDAWSAGIELLTAKDIDEKHKPAVMETLGWVIKEDIAGVWVSSERCLDPGETSFRGHTFIPRSLITTIRPFKLTVPRKKAVRVPPTPDYPPPGLPG
jgi:hypothetical protein